MAGLSSPGIGSGLDINGLITKLMDAEKLPLTTLDKKEADYQAKLTAFGSIKSALATFQTATQGLSSSSKFSTAKVSVADATILSASSSSIAKPGSYAIEVSKIAQSQKIASGVFADPASTIGTGTLTIDFGTYTSATITPLVAASFSVNADKTSKSITIDSTNNSLSGIRDAINQANAGVTASILNDGSGYRLVMTSNDSGKANSLRVLVSNDGDANNTDATTGLSQLAYDPLATVGSGKNITEKLAAQNAEFTVDGVAVSKSSNSIGDVIAGVTLNLLSTTATGKPTTLTVSRDTTNVKTAVEGFVKAHNDMAAAMKELAGYDFKTQKGGLLQGDATLRGLQSQVRSIISQRLDYADGGVSSLSDIGVSFQRDGVLSINSSKLDSVLSDPAKSVAGLFAIMGVPSDSLVSYGTSTSATKPGRYGLNITQIATNGTATGANALGASTVIAAGANDSIMLKLNGNSATITLNAGTYTQDELVAELQSKINSSSWYQSHGHKVSVAQTAGILKLTSTLYGSSSSVVVTGGNAAATLFGSTTSITGVDVAGEVGGVTGTGAGQVLTGAGDAGGLQLLIQGGNTGARGTVGFSRGIAWQLGQTLTGMLGTEGALASRTEGIDRSITDIDSRREVLNKRMADIEKRYRAQFNGLDQLIASMQQTSTYLTQQLANLPGSSSSK
jgi:flagellar hook-associated protein 2